MLATGRTWGEAIVADDDPFFRLALASVLGDHFEIGRVHQVASLDDALETLADAPTVDLALFDLAMPGMASPASLTAIRECHPNVTVVVVSGSVRREDVFQAPRAGARGYVPKSTSIEALVAALRMIREGFVFVPAFVTRIDDTPGLPPRSAPAVPEIAGCLTPRQREVLGLIAEGRSNKEIARTLSLGEGTVKFHVTALLRALAVPDRAAAAWSMAHPPSFPPPA